MQRSELIASVFNLRLPCDFSLWSFRLILISLTRRPDSVPNYATINQMSIFVTTDEIIVA